MNTANSALLKALYPPPHTQKSRSPTNPLRLLCLGLPRSGTDSLRTALSLLGFHTIFHGFELASSRAGESYVWVQLLEVKVRDTPADRAFLKAFDWDSLVGDCDALSDTPPVLLWEQLMDFYPEAKVIVTHRKGRDLVGWHASLTLAERQVLKGPAGMLMWVLKFFDRTLFWWYRAVGVLSIGTIMGYGESFEKRGLEFGKRHYEAVGERLRRETREGGRRKWMDWEAVDGWDGLCEFLEVEKPEGVDFPWENKSGDVFKKKADQAAARMLGRAARNLVILLTVAVSGVAVAWRRYT